MPPSSLHPKRQYVIVIRHGERTDAATGIDDPTGDPPLTEAGKAKIAAAANRIYAALSHDVVANAEVRSSPFRRCRETADGLAAAGIGSLWSGGGDAVAGGYRIDNALCEVFGTTRIKTPRAPEVAIPKALGKLPKWGESIDEAAARYNVAMARAANDAFPRAVVLVTHGDALMATMAKYYPTRVVYNCEYLGFLVFSRSAKDKPFRLSAADGVDWMIDGDDEQSAQSSEPDAPLIANEAPPPHMRVAGDTVAVQVVEVVAAGSSVPHGGGSQPSSLIKSRSTPGLSSASTSATSSIGPNAGSGGSQSGVAVQMARGSDSDEEKPCRRHDPSVAIALRIAAVSTQLPLIRFWPDLRSAIIYCLLATVAEVVSFRLRRSSESTPLIGPQRVLNPLLSTSIKMLLVFAAYAPVATIAAVAMSDKPLTPLGAFTSNFTTIGSGLCYAAYVTVDVYRGWLDNLRRCA